MDEEYQETTNKSGAGEEEEGEDSEINEYLKQETLVYEKTQKSQRKERNRSPVGKYKFEIHEGSSNSKTNTNLRKKKSYNEAASYY